LILHLILVQMGVPEEALVQMLPVVVLIMPVVYLLQ
jgi:hypothetical protein